MGKLRKRMSFSRIDEVLEMPNLIEVQKNSYQRFLDTDLREVLNDVSPITDYNGNLVLEFVDYSLDEPKNSVARCREREGLCPSEEQGDRRDQGIRCLHGRFSPYDRPRHLYH